MVSRPCGKHHLEQVTHGGAQADSLQARRHPRLEVRSEESLAQSHPRCRRAKGLRGDRRSSCTDGAETAEQPTVRAMRCTWLVWMADHLARYGVARVYSQQCGYVLTDVEAARNSMRAMFKSLKTSELDEQGHKGR